jgi:hypothetical protein
MLKRSKMSAALANMVAKRNAPKAPSNSTSNVNRYATANKLQSQKQMKNQGMAALQAKLGGRSTIPEGRGQIGMGLGNVGKPLPGRQTASPAPAGPTLRSGQIPAGGFGALRAQLGDTSTAPMQASANASNLQRAMSMGAPSGSPQMPSMGQNLPQVGAQSPMGKPPMQAGGAGGLMNQASPMGMKKGGAVKTFKKGGSVDGCAQRGKTKGRYI